MFQIDYSPGIWRERYTDGGLEYAESSGSSAFSITEGFGPPRGVSVMAFSSDARILATLDQTRPTIVWIWAMETTPRLISALVHEHAVRHITWHPSKTELLLTTANNTLAAVRHWSLNNEPAVIQIPLALSDTGRYDVTWVAAGQNDHSTFWFGTSKDYVVGYLLDDGPPRFELLNSLSSKDHTR